MINTSVIRSKFQTLTILIFVKKQKPSIDTECNFINLNELARVNKYIRTIRNRKQTESDPDRTPGRF